MKNKIMEYGGKEKYASKTQMMKHEKAESSKMEKKEKMMAKGGLGKLKAPSIMIAVAMPKAGKAPKAPKVKKPK